MAKKKKGNWFDELSVRWAVAQDRAARLTGRGRFQAKRTMTLMLGAALSVGGVNQAFEDTRLVVQKDLDRVNVVRENGTGSKIVAQIRHEFAGNGVLKIARILPDSLVTQESNLFENAWMDVQEVEKLRETNPTKADELAVRITNLNGALRAEFFKERVPFGELIHANATKYDVDPALVAAIMEQESRFKPRARSHVGAMGLMQLMPRTGRWMGAKNLYNPDQNVEAGVKYLAYLDDRFDGDLKRTIAAYNAGEGNVKRYGGIPPFRETRTYVKKVLQNYEKRTRELETYGRLSNESVKAEK